MKCLVKPTCVKWILDAWKSIWEVKGLITMHRKVSSSIDKISLSPPNYPFYLILSCEIIIKQSGLDSNKFKCICTQAEGRSEGLLLRYHARFTVWSRRYLVWYVYHARVLSLVQEIASVICVLEGPREPLFYLWKLMASTRPPGGNSPWTPLLSQLCFLIFSKAENGWARRVPMEGTIFSCSNLEIK